MKPSLILGLFAGLVTSILTFNYIYNKNIVIDPTPTPVPTVTPSSLPDSSKTPDVILSPEPITYQEIGPDESVRVQCGQGSDGARVVFPQGQNGFAANVGKGDQTETTIRVIDAQGQPAGGMVEWKLYYWGKLRVDGCHLTFIAPDSIRTASQVSGTITAKVVNNSPSSSPTSAGEGGPINVGYVATTKINILSGQVPTCQDPEGVSVSINSVSTFRNVEIVIDTPRVVDRVFNGRVATARDGPGTYYIEYYVDGALYDATTSQVGKCRLETVRR